MFINLMALLISPTPSPTVRTINYPIARIANIPNVFHLDEVVVPDTIQVPSFRIGPNGQVVFSGFSNPMPLAEALARAKQYINHEGDPATVHLHFIDGTIQQTVLSGFMTPSNIVKRIRIPPSEHSKRFTVEVGLQVGLQVTVI